MTIKANYWKWLIVLMSTAYILPEAIFNAQIVQLIGMGNPSPQQLENLELFGRTISGIGVSLLVLDLLPAKLVKTPFAALFTCILTLAIIWPAIFYGQKSLIENVLIQSSSAQQRQNGYLSTLLRGALVSNAIAIDGVSYHVNDGHSPVNLTFMTLFGGLLFADDNLLYAIDQDKRQIIQNSVRQKANKDFEQNFSNYQYMYTDMKKRYKSYATASQQYNQSLRNITQKELEYWTKIEQQISDGWDKYQSAQIAHISKASGRAQHFGPKIVKHFENMARCRRYYENDVSKLSTCYKTSKADYRAMIQKAGLGYVLPEYWTIKQKRKFSSGSDNVYTQQESHYFRKFRSHKKFNDLFIQEHEYPSDIDTFWVFRNHPVTARAIIKKIGRRGHRCCRQNGKLVSVAFLR